jgi:signal transduction histidine kinase
MTPHEHLIEETAKREKADERATAGLLALELMHEIRNPLDALDNLIYLSLQKAGEPETVRGYLRLAREQTATLSQISATVLDFARCSLLPKSTCLVAVPEAALRIHQTTIEGKRINVVKNLPESLNAQVHSGEILQLVSNLIANALDAPPLEGTLWLKLQKRRDQVHLVVADNGHEYPANPSLRFFSRFSRRKKIAVPVLDFRFREKSLTITTARYAFEVACARARAARCLRSPCRHKQPTKHAKLMR